MIRPCQGLIIGATLILVATAPPAMAQSFLKPVLQDIQEFQATLSGKKNKRSKSRRKRLKPGTQVAIPLPIRPAKKIYIPPPGYMASPDAARQMATDQPSRFTMQPSPKEVFESQPSEDLAANAPVRAPVEEETKPAPQETIAPNAKPSKPTQPDKIAPPPPDVWSQSEMNIAKARCTHLLKQVDAVTFARPPIKKGPCGDPHPLMVATIGTNPEVSINPPATMNCAMIAALYKWLQNDIQPMARKMLGSPVTGLKNMSSYSCRNRYGRKNGKLSEHARANALDIGAFVTKSGRTVSLLDAWGPTKRDLAKAIAEAKRAREEAHEKAEAARKATADAETPLATKVAAKPADAETDGSKLGGPAAKPAPPPKLPKRATTKSARFLHSAHVKACKIFGTVLGPEANDAHRNHFHIDLAYRRRSNYCQ